MVLAYSPGPSWAGSFHAEAVTMPATRCTCVRDGRLDRVIADPECQATHERRAA